MRETGCLPLQSLKDYLAGWTDADRSQQIEAHISECSICEETIAALEPEPDTLAVMVRSAVSVQPDEAASLSRALANAASLVEPGESSMENATPQSAMIRQQIGPYLLLKPLGSGGMGSVYLAKHQQLGKHVAIKLLPIRFGRRDHFEARFQREIRAAGGLDHPAIVSSTDAGEDQGTHYLVMENIDGLDLSRLVRSCGKLQIVDACELIRQAALGLSHAHEAGIVHRDIKPSNLMLNRRGQLKILDFGLARLGPWNEFSVELTTVGQLMGTLDYMAPEQAERPEAADYRADIYSLGATLFRLLCGRAPLAASPDQSPLTKLRLLGSQDPPRLNILRADAPEALVDLVGEMLARDPNDRPASAAHIAQRLEPLCRAHNLTELLGRALENLDINNPNVEAPELPNIQPVNPLTATANPSLAKVSTSISHWSRWIAITLACLLLGGSAYSGVTIWLDGQQGWLHIDSEARVTVELLAEAESVKHWKIEPGANSTRLYAGKYRIVLEEGSDGVEIDNDQLQVLKGGLAIAKISRRPSEATNMTGDKVVAIPTASSATLVPGDALTPTASSEALFKGKKLSEWMQVIPLERDTEGISDALNAVKAATSEKNRVQVGEFLMRELPQVNWQSLVGSDELYSLAFEILREANPDGYFNYLRQQLEGSNNETWNVVLLKCALPDQVTEKVTETDIAPLHEWVRLNVFAKPSPYLMKMAQYYWLQALRQQEPKFWLQALVDSPELNDLFWLEAALANDLEPRSYSVWEELIRRAISSLEDPDADAQKLVYACGTILRCPKGLVEANAQRLAAIWQRQAQQLALSESLRNTVVDVPFHKVQVKFFALTKTWLPFTVPPTSQVTVMFAMAMSLGSLGPTPDELCQVLVPGAAQALNKLIDSGPWNVKFGRFNGASLLLFGSSSNGNLNVTNREIDSAQLSDLLSLQQICELLESDDKTLSPIAEACLKEFRKIHTQNLFSAINSDAAGKLNFEDAANLPLQSLSPARQLSPTRQTELLKSLDLDQDQFISIDEYIKYREEHSSSRNMTGLPPGTSQTDLAWAVKMISKFDKDQDGMLSQEEQSKMLVKPKETDDTNKDGMIDATEYARSRIN